jgi:hypothetical protein
MRFYILHIAAIFIITYSLRAQEAALSLKNIREKQISIAGFVLNSAKTIHVDVVGAGNTKPLECIHNLQNDKFNLFAYAWILDAASRKMVWRMTIDNSEKEWWDKWSRTFHGDINLPSGRYELYFAAIEPPFFNIPNGFVSLGRLFDKMLGDDTWWDDHSKKWLCKVSGIDQKLNEKEIRAALEDGEIIVHISGGNNRPLIKRDFQLKDTVMVSIYAIGEGYKGRMYDYGILINRELKQKVWEMRETETEYAGGAVKNRMIRRRLKLPPGEYRVYYKSDGNHSIQRWNANPPYDPLFWGITISVDQNKFNRRNIIMK